MITYLNQRLPLNTSNKSMDEAVSTYSKSKTALSITLDQTCLLKFTLFSLCGLGLYVVGIGEGGMKRQSQDGQKLSRWWQRVKKPVGVGAGRSEHKYNCAEPGRWRQGAWPQCGSRRAARQWRTIVSDTGTSLERRVRVWVAAVSESCWKASQ